MNTQSHSFDTILSLCPLRSGAFIVTVFGDVVLPGDGQMWIGHLIELCADLRISETLVRTSVSRLVTSGQLVGTRKGRRSFYALSPGARAEFDHAAQVIYTAPQERPWRFLFFPAGHSPDALQKLGMAALSPQLAFGPARGAVPEGALAFTAHADGARADLAAMLAHAYPLEELAQEYRAFCTLEQAIAGLPKLTPKTALQARLVLTHAWRRIALNAPRLPANLLPEGYPEPTARAAFGRSYLALTAVAEPLEADILSMDSIALDQRQRAFAERRAALSTSA
ncbi:MAG: phenylacetic acid-responsive transcriptional repressor PaaX [Roseibaca calidilacus]|uniref:Phenylacetic acid-responsive transcriptional repressor PaaX n=1 Tax=Roseibaca calidilacus TaxID=1666912 RepID=A0A0P7WJ97_9RHOB|nr:PaaX family transcriptional regulator C-terminal domain-containing protein [Roseibaca calidilacus]KPP90711.1 MAG: phenylacetic acid-responsive transcriptional repressor PaaX [Roseibaca calidilacus]CUX83430.1 transcriptional regulator, PaaX family [Roseibaca calidilacus]